MEKVLVTDNICSWFHVDMAQGVFCLNIIKCFAKVFATLLNMLFKVHYVLLKIPFGMSILYSTQITFCQSTQVTCLTYSFRVSCTSLIGVFISLIYFAFVSAFFPDAYE